ncbi:hypothetical protein [Maricaulis sp.]|jgi:hypothetical protein|uniref:hypothetical protein n=1 Tax=Maricaulis sp. TaxID=1486257 RepID=UPI002630B8AB|nr:hypothetical protein [Maricaulis sp.]
MLFLFNDVVFDLGDLNSVLRSGEIPLTSAQVEALTAGQLNALVREAVFADPNIAKNKPKHVKHLVALITYVAPGANALLAVRPDGAKTHADVGLRYAHVPIETLAYLWGRQSDRPLMAADVNSAVWTRSSGPLPQATGTG